MAVKTDTLTPQAGKTGKRGPGRQGPSWPTHLALIVAVLIISTPLIFALIKSTQASGQVISPNTLPVTSFGDHLRSIWLEAKVGRYLLTTTNGAPGAATRTTHRARAG